MPAPWMVGEVDVDLGKGSGISTVAMSTNGPLSKLLELLDTQV